MQNGKPLTTSILVTLGLALAVTVGSACTGPTTDSSGPTNTEGDSLRVCATSSTLVQGLDVSVYDGSVDWASVKASGRQFAIARVSDGTGTLDTQFASNWSGIRAQGMVRGVYQYFRASESAVAQADLLVAQIGSLQAGDLPPVIDVETDDGVSAADVSAGVAAWLAEIKAKLGVEGIIYCAESFWDSLPNTSQFASNTLWVANYGESCPTLPSTWSSWAIWQYSDTGSVAGVDDQADLDEFNGSYAQLLALTVGGSGTSSSSSSSGSASSSSSSGSTSSSSSSSSSSGAAPACDVDGTEGTCIQTSACAAKLGYTSTPGYCPGPGSEECCTPPPSCSVGGVTGVCISTTLCASMSGYKSTPGYCPGPDSEECCTE